MFFPITCLIIVLVINLIKTPTFFHVSINNGVLYGYIIDILNRASELVILAIGMTLVVACSGGTDISVGAVSAVAGAITIYLLVGPMSSGDYRMPYVLAILLGLLGAVLCGMFNGFLIARLKIQPMVATLILYTAGRGIAQVITQGFIIYVRKEEFKYLGNFIPGIPVPTPIIIATIVLILTNLLLKKTALGLYIQTVGVNRRAAKLVGLNSSLFIFLVYAFSGLCAGISGMIITSRVYSIDANNAGLNIELDAILAVAIGGNRLDGGKFSLAGSIVGAITIQALTTTLYAMKVTADQLPVYKAIVVVFIVVIQSSEFKRYIGKLLSRITKHGDRKQVEV
ncbi:MAG: ABC transporter permease [Clostridiales bacterium]|nr:ABC transporter permease [Clostridiales bacterium]